MLNGTWYVCFPSGDHHAKKNNRPTPKIALVLTIRRKCKLKKTSFNLLLVILNLKVPSGFRPSQPHTKRANFTFNIIVVRKPFCYYLVLSFVARDLPWYSLDSLFTRDFLWVIHQSKHSWKYYVMLPTAGVKLNSKRYRFTLGNFSSKRALSPGTDTLKQKAGM